jgi:hypothetical protein
MASAQWALGKKTLVVDGQKFNMDCSGVILAIYYRAGINLLPRLSDYRGGGVQRLYALMEEGQLLYKQTILAPGDMLFWDNTYDRDNDGKMNDPLTHVGMVVSADNRGNIRYIHYHYKKGIILANMNLMNPDDLDLNSPMRARNSEEGHATLWLSSHLLKNAARAYELEEL